MNRIGVFHLVRKKNGLEPFLRFLTSYRCMPAEEEHDLVVIFKGFNGPSDLAPYREQLEGVPHREMSVKDSGFDIMPYFAAAESNEYRYLCFFNSFSVLREGGWLRKLFSNLRKSGVGIVGATGSWQSSSSYWEKRMARRAASKSEHRDLSDYPVAREIVLFYMRRWFPPFPNYHIRTNAFLVPRDIFLPCRPRRVFIKYDAYRFECGWTGMTRQIMARDLRALIVGRDGAGYEKDQWWESNTYWRSAQENLLVEDKQTRQYSNGTPEWREILTRHAWGDFGRSEPAGFPGGDSPSNKQPDGRS